MKIKTIFKKVFPWLEASFYFYPNKTLDFLNLPETSKEICINAKVENFKSLNQSKNSSNQIENPALQNYIQNLNKSEVYLLVTKPTNKKISSNILLVLQSENHLNSTATLINKRAPNIAFRRFNQKSANLIKNVNLRIQGKKGKIRLRQLRLRQRLRFPFILKAKRFFPVKRYFTTSNLYNINNLGGYKSICPVFFDKNTAEDFLSQITKETLSISNFSLGSDPGSIKILKSIMNSKIITLGLGDFIHYYSSTSNEEFLNKVEFLFFPNLEELSKNQKKTTKHSSPVNFSFYQNKYYKLKS